jgi:hypothetical protein
MTTSKMVTGSDIIAKGSEWMVDRSATIHRILPM